MEHKSFCCPGTVTGVTGQSFDVLKFLCAFSGPYRKTQKVRKLEETGQKVVRFILLAYFLQFLLVVAYFSFLCCFPFISFLKFGEGALQEGYLHKNVRS